MQSNLVLYSLGIVLENKKRNSDEIIVIPIEHVPLVDGNINNLSIVHKASGKDHSGTKVNSNVTGDYKLIAKWFPLSSSNRTTSPDVVANETVRIFKFADDDTYYWATLFREPSLRRLETVCFSFSDLASGVKAFDKDSSYWFEVSTHDQKIQLHTAKSNGEPFTYDFIINTRLGEIIIQDNIGNNIILNSREGHIEVNANIDVTVNSPTVNINANVTNISNNLNVGGNVAISGSTSIGESLTVSKGLSTGSGGGSGASISGNIVSNGSIQVNGNLNATGTIHGSNIT